MATMKFCDRCNRDITKVESNRVIKVNERDTAYSGKEYDLCAQCLNNFNNVWMRTALPE